MEYKLEIKPFKRKDGMKYKILQLTDIQLHTKGLAPSSVGKNITKSLKTKQPGRIYSPLPKEFATNNILTVFATAQNDPVLLKTIQNYERDGYKVLIAVPEAGVPVYLGKDMEEFMKSVKGKRILRKLRKEAPMS